MIENQGLSEPARTDAAVAEAAARQGQGQTDGTAAPPGAAKTEPSPDAETLPDVMAAAGGPPSLSPQPIVPPVPVIAPRTQPPVRLDGDIRPLVDGPGADTKDNQDAPKGTSNPAGGGSTSVSSGSSTTAPGASPGPSKAATEAALAAGLRTVRTDFKALLDQEFGAMRASFAGLKKTVDDLPRQQAPVPFVLPADVVRKSTLDGVVEDFRTQIGGKASMAEIPVAVAAALSSANLPTKQDVKADIAAEVINRDSAIGREKNNLRTELNREMPSTGLLWVTAVAALVLSVAAIVIVYWFPPTQPTPTRIEPTKSAPVGQAAAPKPPVANPAPTAATTAKVRPAMPDFRKPK